MVDLFWRPRSLATRQLLAAGLGLVAFLALVGVALDRAFIDTAENNLQVRLAKSGAYKATRMWLVAPPPAGVDFSAWSSEAIAAFDEHLKGWEV